jgi:hypothetical protein
MEEYIKLIASQGFGYLLFVASMFVCFFLYKENRKLNQDKVDISEKRVEDLKEAQANYGKMSEASQIVAQNTLTIVTNLQNLLNKAK